MWSALPECPCPSFYLQPRTKDKKNLKAAKIGHQRCKLEWRYSRKCHFCLHTRQMSNASCFVIHGIFCLRCLTKAKDLKNTGVTWVSSPIKTSRLIRGLSPQSCGVSFSSYSSWTPCSITWWALPGKATMPWKHIHTHTLHEWRINHHAEWALETD